MMPAALARELFHKRHCNYCARQGAAQNPGFLKLTGNYRAITM
jgi:hypothetical protein